MENENGKQRGRPLKFKDPKELQKKIDQYFKTTGWQQKKVLTKRGDVLDADVFQPATLIGLAVFLDVDRKTLFNYKKRDSFFPIISRAKDKCAVNIAHGGLMNQFNPVVTKMVMAKEQDYYDKQQVDVADKTDYAKDLSKAHERMKNEQ